MPYKDPSHRRASVYVSRRRAHDRAVQELGGRCVDCGEADPNVLQFHHRDPKTKRFNLAHRWLDSWASLLPEILKCDLLCANCHMRRHVKRPNGLRPEVT